MPIPFDTYHRDDQPPAVRAAFTGALPVVLADTDAGLVPLVDAAELASCAGSIERLLAAIETAVMRAGLAWPTPAR